VVQGVASDRYGIGYSGIGYKTADVKAVPLKADANTPAIAATPEFAYTGKYPLARFLYVYANYKPGTELDPLRREFIRFVFSKEGQESVVKDGYYPVNTKIAGEEMAKLGLQVTRR
jgi:phosphate transport system substrate-binding protein